MRKQRSGASASDWCTPGKLADKQLFPCRQIHIYDNDHLTDNSWYAFGEMGEGGAFEVDKEAITERVLSDLGPCVRCPILDLDTTAEIVARLPEKIEPGKDAAWRYKEDGPLNKWAVVKTHDGREKRTQTPAQEDRESLIERVARSVRSGGAGVAAAGGMAPGTRNVPATRYEDVGGMRETIALVREAVELPITHPEIFKKLNIRPHKGILFYGPPGTGKTLLARAVAHECGAHFVAVSGPEILNKYWGQSEARLRSIFNEGRAKAPAVILFDEIDSFASSRDMMSESFEATLVSQLLSLMDGLNDLGRVCVIATTNRPAALDPALRRPGSLRPRDRDRAPRRRGPPAHPEDPHPRHANGPRPGPEAHRPAHRRLLRRRPRGAVPRGRPRVHASHHQPARLRAAHRARTSSRPSPSPPTTSAPP